MLGFDLSMKRAPNFIATKSEQRVPQLGVADPGRNLGLASYIPMETGSECLDGAERAKCCNSPERQGHH
jgi:hypothetical protein